MSVDIVVFYQKWIKLGELFCATECLKSFVQLCLVIDPKICEFKAFSPRFLLYFFLLFPITHFFPQ